MTGFSLSLEKKKARGTAMNRIEIFGFIISIIISVYLYREVRELKEKIVSKVRIHFL